MGKPLRWRLGISALAGLFHVAKRQVYSALARKICASAKWICAAATCVAAEVQRDYLNFRLDHGLVTYDDQIALAEELLQHPIAAPRIREESFRVILDEAQDTEPSIFGAAGSDAPAGSEGPLVARPAFRSAAGHFCMVGDFQQSIYWQARGLELLPSSS
jgi:Superfamily I DNA and RNA helicases